MLGLLAAAVLVGYVLTVWLRSGWFALVFWMAVIGVACWVALLAAVDIWATKHHFGRLRLLPGGTSQAPGRNPHIQAVRGNGKGRQESSKKEQKQRRRQRLTVGESGCGLSCALPSVVLCVPTIPPRDRAFLRSMSRLLIWRVVVPLA